MRKTTKIVFLSGVLALASCSGVKPPETYTDQSGNTTIIETDHEKCVRGCNSTYSRCMDAGPAQDSNGLVGGAHGVTGPSGMFGASADCRNDLQDCLPGCNAR